VEAHQTASPIRHGARASDGNAGIDRALILPMATASAPISGMPRSIVGVRTAGRANTGALCAAARGSGPQRTQFTPITYPQGQYRCCSRHIPPNRDATWGIMSAVYGGAPPDAEGHAAMAEPTLPTMRAVPALQPAEPRCLGAAAAGGSSQRAARPVR